MRIAAWAALVATMALVPGLSLAAGEDELVSLINARRVETRGCSGYGWRVVGENIAAGQGSALQVVAGWLACPGHCANILSPDFREMGTAYGLNPKAAMEIYWTQVLGTR